MASARAQAEAARAKAALAEFHYRQSQGLQPPAPLPRRYFWTGWLADAVLAVEIAVSIHFALRFLGVT